MTGTQHKLKKNGQQTCWGKDVPSSALAKQAKPVSWDKLSEPYI